MNRLDLKPSAPNARDIPSWRGYRKIGNVKSEFGFVKTEFKSVIPPSRLIESELGFIVPQFRFGKSALEFIQSEFRSVLPEFGFAISQPGFVVPEFGFVDNKSGWIIQNSVSTFRSSVLPSLLHTKGVRNGTVS